MMAAEMRDAISRHLHADSSIAALVGGDYNTARIFAGHLAQGVLQPSLVLNRVAGAPDYHMQGPSGLAWQRLQIDAWAQDPDTASELADLVRTRLSGFRGLLPYGAETPQQEVRLHGTFVLDEAEGYDPESQLYRSRQDFRVVWTEP